MVAAVVGGVTALFVVVRDITHMGGLGAFALAGQAFVDPDATSDLPVYSASNGYDGQFFYRLALDPLTRQTTAFHITLDNPPYRQQRIGLPAAAWLLHEVSRVPTSMALVLVNVFAVIVAGWVGAQWARRFGRSPLWGVAIGASPALIMAVARDLSEPLATAALLVGLLVWTRGGRLWAASAAFTVAVLCRETVLIVLLGMGLWCLGRFVRGGNRALRRTAAAQVAALCVPAAVEIAWQLYLQHVWGGRLPTFSGQGQLGTSLLRPLHGFFAGFDQIGLTHVGILAAVFLVERVLLLALLIVVASGLLRSSAPAELRLGWVLAAVLATSVAWNQDVQFVRAANEAIIVGQLLLLARTDRIARVATAGVLGWSALVAVIYAGSL